MGISADQVILIGFKIDQMKLTTPFWEEIAEPQYKMEDRFCPRTGAKLESEQVLVSQGSHRFTYKGVDITEQMDGDPDHLASLIAKDLGCQYASSGDFMCGNPNYIFYLKSKTIDTSEEVGRHSFGPSLDYQSAIDLQPKLQQLGLKLEDLDIDAEGPSIWNAVTIC